MEMKQKILVLVACIILVITSIILFVKLRAAKPQVDNSECMATETEQEKANIEILQKGEIIAALGQEIHIPDYFSIQADQGVKKITIVSEQKEIPFENPLHYDKAELYGDELIVTDKKGNEKTQEFTIRVVNDAIIEGIADQTFEQGDEKAFTNFLAGIHITDEVDGDISAIAETNTTEIDVNTPGQYTFSCKVVTSYGKTYEMSCVIMIQEKKEPVVEEVEEPQTPEAPVQNDWIASWPEAQTSSQILAVVSSGTTATVSLHNKDGNGIWTELISTPGFVGQEGVGDTLETNRKTPRGTYGFTMAFGIKPNPGSQIAYTQVNDSHYWVDDPASQYYNQFVSTDSVTPDWNSAEHLSGCVPEYNYALALNYNSACIPGKGSAIFLHCSSGSSTYGCIAVPENVMISLLQNITPGCTVVIK